MTGIRVLVCVAWPYANGALHLGHMAGSIMPADIFARYNRMRDNRVIMVSGSDMHGAPITVRADREGSTPEEIAFRFHEINRRALSDIGASFDLYTHTHTDNHVRTVHNIFQKLLDDGHLEKRTTPQYYCSSCARFLPDRYVEGVCPFCGNEKARGDQCDECGKAIDAEELKDAKCQLCSSKPKLRDTEHYFFKLTSFEERLKDYVAKRSNWRTRVSGFTENILNEGLQDRAITRDISWGVPVPIAGFEDKRIYVWFEAVIGYLSASMEWAAATGDEHAWTSFWEDPECRSYYFLGKDNIIFHTIIWPAILMGKGDLNLPYDVPANEFMNLEGQKFSKSAGISIDLPTLLGRFQPDALRYYLSVNMPEIKDTEFSWDDFVAKINNELVATYGNFVHRVLSFTYKNFGEIPPADAAPDDLINEVSEQIKMTADAYSKAIENCNFKSGLKAFMDLARYGNQFFDSTEPWALLRKDRDGCGAVLNLSMRIVEALSVLSYPYLPFSSSSIWQYLGHESPIEEIGWSTLNEDLPVGRVLAQPKPLFKKIELEVREESDFSGIQRLNLKIGVVDGVETHPKADKLYLMRVDVGRKMSIVSGLKGFYSPEQLRGKKIVVLTNLEPATIRGVESEGMLLAAESGDSVSLLVPAKDVDIGMPVNSGYTQSDRSLPFAEFQKMQLVIGRSEGAYADIGDRIPIVGCEPSSKDMKLAFLVEKGNALCLRCENGIEITVDKEIPIGAKVR